MRGIMAEGGYVPRFSGHETFPFRYGWLTKFARYATGDDSETEQERSTLERQMMALGVGKNMVGSMRYWAQASGMIDGATGRMSRLGERLIGIKQESGWDPYLEQEASLWLIHWRLAGPVALSGPHRTATWYWAFNHFPSARFTRETLLGELLAAAHTNGWAKASKDTLKRDIDCFIGTYSSGRSASDGALEDTIVCPLAELGLLRASIDGKSFEFWNGEKAHLPDGLFAFAVAEYKALRVSGRVLSLETLAFEPGSPGRVFRLGVEDVAVRLERIEEASAGRFAYVDTAGLRQVQDLASNADPLAILEQTFGGNDAMAEGAA